MTTVPRQASDAKASRPAHGRPEARRTGRDQIARTLGAFTALASSPLLDRFGLRSRAERAAFHMSKTSMSTAGTASRVFSKMTNLTGPQRLPKAPPTDLIDLTPTEDQQMLVEVVKEFAEEKIRPAAEAADKATEAPKEILTTAVELGIMQLGAPEALGGFSEHRSPTTGVLVAEHLAHGDLGLALACLAPASVGTALGLWGDAEQQATYMPAFVSENPPVAALAITESKPLFDPFRLDTTATVTPEGYRLDGAKALVPAGDRAELFVIAANVIAGGSAQGPALFLVESGSRGITVKPEPAMGIRAARTTRVQLDGVLVPTNARLGTEEDNPYRDAIRLSRIAWSALAVGTAQAVVDYVIPYVNDRVAFGEPISNRQGVAFTVADMATEVDGMRLATYRAASRAEQGVDFSRETALARRLCSEHGMTVGSDGVQMLGGHGFIKDHPVERWFRDLRAISFMEGVVLV
jgi:alkylation response protein AidB-like acyl-CoA dehydrogenase